MTRLRYALSRRLFRLTRRRAPLALAAVTLVAGSVSAWAIVTEPELQAVRSLHAPIHVKTHQDDLNRAQAEDNEEAFLEAFELGDTIFGNVFNAVDGSGNNVGNGERYTHVPRADLKGHGQWFSHFPPRVTGPNAAACFECHNIPVEDGGGFPSGNVHRDTFRGGDIGRFIQRNAPHLFGSGGIQRLAEEMTDELRGKTAAAIAGCTAIGCQAVVTLTAKGVSFGTVTITRRDVAGTPPNNCMGTDATPFIDPADCLAGVTADVAGLQGISRDLVVRPFQWKGSVAFVRDFNRDASNQEIGMQAVEMAGEERDGDFDGVVNELRVGDQTALALYIAGQPRPTTRQELSRLGLIPRLSRAENDSIGRGERAFTAAACNTCHVPSLTINRPTFSEPSQNANYRDLRFPAGQDPLTRLLSPRTAITFDLTRDHPDNRIMIGTREVRFGSFERGRGGSAIVRLYGDLKRHKMGPRLAESIDEVMTGSDVFLTENLWGVGSTPPYLHDGRATTLTEAILLHGGEGEDSQRRFVALTAQQKTDLIAFLNNQVLFTVEEEEE